MATGRGKTTYNQIRGLDNWVIISLNLPIGINRIRYRDRQRVGSLWILGSVRGVRSMLLNCRCILNTTCAIGSLGGFKLAV